MQLEQIREEVKHILSEKRYKHSLGVEKRAAELGAIYGVDIEKAKLAGITHDIAKEMTKEEIFAYAQENGIQLSPIEREIPKVLHGKIGADICKKKYGFDEELQKAIAYHTTGAPDMDTLAKIIYLADITEENRTFDDLPKIKSLSETNLDEAMLYALNRELISKIKEDKLIHPATLETRNEILKNRLK